LTVVAVGLWPPGSGWRAANLLRRAVGQKLASDAPGGCGKSGPPRDRHHRAGGDLVRG
jgi:hypothetical protein